MKVLVCVGNNLKYDTRVKRHINAIKKRGHDVHVIACPVPNEEWGMDEGISHNFSSYTPSEAPINDIILDFAKEFNLESIFLNSFPILECYTYYNESDLKRYTKKLNQYVAGSRWIEIRNRVSEPMEDVYALSYPLVFFDRAVQFAQSVLEHPADVILCNDEDTLLAGVAHKKKYGSRIIYDFHDLMADITDGVFPQMYSNVLALFEKQMIQYADVVMSISKAELNWSQRHYGCVAPMVPMLNCSECGISKDKLGKKKITKDKIRIYYHGMSDESRGLAELIDAVKEFPEFSVVLRCLPSDNLDKIKERIKLERRENQVVFLEPVESKRIVEMTNVDGDIGFSFCHTERCINWKCALTNKFIEYTKAGLPIITSPTEEQGELVRKNKMGWVLKENSVEGIKDVLRTILKEKRALKKMSRQAYRVGKTVFNWKYYEESLEAVISGDINKINKRKVPFIPNQMELLLWENEDKDNNKENE